MWSVSPGTGIVILSGDRHEFAGTAFPPPEGSEWPVSATVHEFSTSPLSMFYLPFRTYEEREGEGEPCVKYVPDGNSKFGAVEVMGGKGEQGVMRFRLDKRYSQTFTHMHSPPVESPTYNYTK
ncbi:MAG: hypothetical protein Q9169_006736 [Polycauliona sp. 2 TL-2023]